MLEKDKWMSIGEIVAPQGLRGDIRIKPSSDFPERFTKPGKRWIQKGNEFPIEIKLKKGKLIPGKSMKQAEKDAASKALKYLDDKKIDL